MARTYVGRRDDSAGRVDVYGPGGVSALRDASTDRPRPFSWGAVDGDAVALAHALLADVFGVGATDGLAVTFAADVIAQLPPAGFALGEDDVRRWRDPPRERRLTPEELIDHLGAVAIADEDDEAALLDRIVARCWDERELRH